MTLKKRIAIIFALCMLIPYACITAVSYVAISSILVNKTQAGIQDSLKEVLLFLETTIRNLNHISQQLTLEGAVGSMVQEYLANPNPFERSRLKLEIRNELNLLAFTNPNVGLITYYFEDGSGTKDLESMPVKRDFDPDRLPLLARYYGITYFGPHPSKDRFSDQYVLSALRKVGMPDRDDVYVYIESGFKLAQRILSGDRVGAYSLHLMLDNDGRVAYSEVPAAFPVDSRFLPASPLDRGRAKGYYWFKATGNQGWSVVSLVPEAEYGKEMVRWMDQIVLLSLVFVALGASLSLLLWRMVYRPLALFSKELGWLDRDGPGFVSIPTRIPEFDSLLGQFQLMKRRIGELIGEVEQKEKRRADLEIENLLFQINPHFLMNSLYTIHWLAVEKGQEEIDRLVLALNRLLYYNLGKLGKKTSLGEELSSLEEYLLLQRTRYDFSYDIVLGIEDGELAIPMPRFVLQPLVENALFHGRADSGHIRVEIVRNSGLEITVSDDGPGISEEKLAELLGEGGMGIGLRYVRRVLETCYGGRAELLIASVVGQGTTARMVLPAEGGGGADD